MSGSGGACCVCERPLDAAETRALGGRVFCAEHLERAARENRAAAGPLLVCIGAVVLFAALVWATEQLTHARLGGVALLAAGIVMALVPGLIWLVAFYQQDRLEPEPKR